MTFGLVLKRSRREWRQLGVLIVAVCLVTAFFALGPLYVRAMIQSGLQYELEAISTARLNLTLISPTPFRAESWDLVSRELGALNGGLTRVARSSSAFPGFQYLYGEVTWEGTPRAGVGFRAYAFSGMRQLLKLVAGRWPDRLPPPNAPERRATTDEQRIEAGLGIYSRGDVEAVVTREVIQGAAKQGVTVEIGTRLAIGDRPEQRVVVHVVGIVEAVNPDEPIWQTNRFALTGEEFDIGRFQTGFNMAFIVPEGAYADWIAAATRLRSGENNSYVWQVKLNSGAVNADNIGEVQARLTELVNRLSAEYAGLTSLNPLLKLLDSYTGLLARIEGPVVLLSGVILVLMLYHLVTTVSLVLEQQTGEWASLSSRGASTLQLVLLQAGSMSLLGLLAFAVGPLLAAVILAALLRIGPLAASTGGIVPISGIPESAFRLSGVAAVLSVVMLTLPAIPAARRSLAQFKQMIARPPKRPAWARFWLDAVLILVGIGFIARLLFFVQGDLGTALAQLANSPNQLIQAMLDSANQTGGLSDPLNLVGPALLLTGVALLWLRLFPVLMRMIGAVFGRGNGLTGPLSVWNVERDPGHYAQLVLLLIGTLALGTAALALATTRDAGAWAVARQSTGGDARIDLVARTSRPDQTKWTDLPGVAGAAVLTRAETEFKAGYTQVFLLGVDAAAIGQAFPELDQIVAPLKDKQVDLLPGIKLPEDAKRLQISAQVPEQSASQFRGATLNRPESLNILVTLNDTYGSQASLTLSGTLTPSVWTVFGTDVPPAPAGRGPWTLSRVQLAPYAQKVQWIGREIRLDTLQTLDANGKSTLLEDFEQDGSDWAPAARGFFRSELDAATAASGKRSLRVEFGVQRLANDPDPGLDDAARQAAQIKAFQTVDLSVAGVRQVAVPAVISARMAREEGRANRPDRMPLQAGDEGTLDLEFTGGKTVLRYRVAGITRGFPSFQDDQYFLVLNARNVGQIVNPVVPSERQIGPNQVWLRLPDRQPGAGLNSALNRLPGVVPDSAVFAWDRYNQLLREPLPAAIAGMLYAGFLVSLLLSLLGFAFYLAVTVKRRSVGFAVLQALGWNARSLWTLLAAEQAALVIPALLIGILLGAALAYVILPFLALIGGQTLSISAANLAALFVALIIGFGVISVGAAWWLRRMSVNQVLRLGEE